MSSGYVRQSTSEIVQGDTINASDFNNEFNSLQTAFDASIGHAHDGTVGGGAPISFSNITLGTVSSTNGGTGVSNPIAHTIPINEGVSPQNNIALTNGQIIIGQTGTDPVAATVTGDAVLSNSGVITVNSTNGKSFAALYDLTNGQIIIGQNSGPTSVSVSGDATLASTGALTVNSIGGKAVSGLATATPTAHGVLIGEGSAAPNSITTSSGQILIGQSSGDPVAESVSGDGTLAANGILTVTKTNGVAFGPLATASSSSPVPVSQGGTNATAAGATASNNIGALAINNNLSDLNSVSAARANLDLGSMATVSSPVPVANGGTGATVSGATAANNIGALAISNNLSDLGSTSTARTNLGLGAIATLGIGTGLVSSGGNLNTTGGASSLTVNGYVEIPGGVYIQWNFIPIASFSGNFTTWDYALTFSNAIFCVQATMVADASTAPGYLSVESVTTSSAVIAINGSGGVFGVYVMAIGY